MDDNQVDHDLRTNIRERIWQAVWKAKVFGGIGGGVVLGAGGAVAGAGVGVGAVIGFGVGFNAGAVACYYSGKKIGRAIESRNIVNSYEFRKWKVDQFKVAIPALLRTMPHDQFEQIQLKCPESRDWMVEPVRATDRCLYEKNALLAHLDAWDKEWIRTGRFSLLSEDGKAQALKKRSPLQICDIKVRDPRDEHTYYDEIFAEIKLIYNQRIAELTEIVAHPEMKPLGSADLIEFYRAEKDERDATVNTMLGKIFLSNLQQKEKENALALLMRASKQLPTILV